MATTSRTKASARLGDVADIHDYLRLPVNATERAARLQGKSEQELYPYYGATGQVGWIDGYRMDGEYVLIGEDGAPFLDPLKSKSYQVVGKAWVNNHAHVLKGKPGILEDRFLLHQLNSIDYIPYVNGTTRLKLTQAALKEIRLFVPSLDVQRRIVARIDELFAELDDGEEELARARQDLERYRKSLLKAAVTGELTADWRAAATEVISGSDLHKSILLERRAAWERGQAVRRKRYQEPTPPDLTGLPTIPASWTWASLDQLAWDSSYGTSTKCDYSGVGEPVLRIPNLKRGAVDLADLKRSLGPLDCAEEDYVRPGDLLIVRTNGSEELIGRAGILDEPLSTPTYYASYLIRFRMTGHMPRWQWIRAFTESPVFRASVLRSIGSSAGQYNLSMSKLATFPVAIPPDDEVSIVLDRWKQAEMRWDDEVPGQYATLRQSILAAAFRGELVS